MPPTLPRAIQNQRKAGLENIDREDPLPCQRRSTRQEVLSVRRVLGPWRQGDFHPTVLSPTLGGRVRGDRLTFAKPLGPNVLPGHAVLYQVVSHRFGSPLRELQVVSIRTDAIRMADN